MAVLWLLTHLGEGLTLSRSRQRRPPPAARIQKTPAGHRGVREPASAAGGRRQHRSPAGVFPGGKETKKEEGEPGTRAAPLKRHAQGGARREACGVRGSAPGPQRQAGHGAAWWMRVDLCIPAASRSVRSPKALTGPCGTAGATSTRSPNRCGSAESWGPAETGREGVQPALLGPARTARFLSASRRSPRCSRATPCVSIENSRFSPFPALARFAVHLTSCRSQDNTNGP